ncbi:MAG: CARDB domain-containing protein [archaeon]
MRWSLFFSVVFFIFAISMLVLYWFVPFSTTEFGTVFDSQHSNYNFSLNSQSVEMQFFPDMRFPNPRISYKIEDCPLQKEDDMEEAFAIVESKTILDFYPTSYNPEIFVTCDSTNKIEEGMFIAGEGGPTNITKTDNFNVILTGKVLLIRDSNCERPNVALHELMHVLGFNHSNNPKNIMYPFSRCDQIISDDQVLLIDELYSTPSYPDLVFENVSAVMNGKYLDVNFSVRNNGLKSSPDTKINLYADDKFIKDVDLEALNIGHGIRIMLTNIWIKKFSVSRLEFVIESNFQELDKENNKVVLNVRE